MNEPFNLSQQYRGQTSSETTPFAFDKRLHYVTAPSGNGLRRCRVYDSVDSSVTSLQASGLTNENTARFLAAR